MKKIIFAVVALGILFKLGYLSNPFAGEPEFVKSYGDSVVLYSTSWCGYCKKTRELFKKNDISYTEYDIEVPGTGKDEYKQLKGRGIPLLIIGGEVVRGYDPQLILKLAKAL